MKQEKTTEQRKEQYLKEIAHFSRKTSNNVQFLFWLVVTGGFIGVLLTLAQIVKQFG